MKRTKAPAIVLDLNKGLLQVSIDGGLWQRFDEALYCYEQQFGAPPTAEEIEHPRDIASWHRAYDWYLEFSQRNGPLLDELAAALIRAARRGRNQ